MVVDRGGVGRNLGGVEVAHMVEDGCNFGQKEPPDFSMHHVATKGAFSNQSACEPANARHSSKSIRDVEYLVPHVTRSNKEAEKSDFQEVDSSGVGAHGHVLHVFAPRLHTKAVKETLKSSGLLIKGGRSI